MRFRVSCRVSTHGMLFLLKQYNIAPQRLQRLKHGIFQDPKKGRNRAKTAKFRPFPRF